MSKKGRILVTGGTGFVGTHLVRELVRHGWPVTVTRFRGQTLSLKKFHPSIIIHLAANTDSDRNPKKIKRLMKDNFDKALHLFNAALGLRKLKGIIVFGSAGEYEQGRAPFVETQREMPASPYSFSKVCMTHLSSYFYRVHGLPIVVVRPSVLYGERQVNNQFIPWLIRRCLQNKTIDMTQGDQAKDFIYVRDLVPAVVRIVQKMEQEKAGALLGNIINLCSGEKIKMREAALLIRKETGSRSRINFGAIPYRNGENMAFYGSNRKAKALLHWSPQYSFGEGIRDTIHWYRERVK